MRTIFHGMLLGISIGLVISIIFSYVFAGGDYYPMSPSSTSGAYFYKQFSETTVLLIALICWSLIGIGFTFAGKIFQKENWAIWQMTIVHFLTVILFFLPLSVVSGWYPLHVKAILFFILMFIVIYAIIWSILLAINIWRINKINHKLSN